MCGIFFSINLERNVLPSETELELLKKRGPDSCNIVLRVIHGYPGGSPEYLTFCSTVLSLRGDRVAQQPLEDPQSGTLLCWNGEAWKYDGKEVQGNDAQVVFSLLLEAAVEPDAACFNPEAALCRVLSVLSKISGPFAFVFYDARNQQIVYGRDVLGRRALLSCDAQDGSFVVSSVCGGYISDAWEEIEADGIYVMDLKQKPELSGRKSKLVPWSPKYYDRTMAGELQSPFSIFNVDYPTSQPPALGLDSPTTTDLADLLIVSLSTRVQNIPAPPSEGNPTRLAVLFSGGLDCTLLARICHINLPKECEIDLLNVAFENPRVVKAAAQKAAQSSHQPESPYSTCPDRLTGLTSHEELLRVCPRRTWRFVSVDVSYQELLAHRPQIQSLIHPHNTEMDLSIASALYFAARGAGLVHDSSTGLVSAYASPARVLLSGLGADELFGGYTRHATAFARNGYEGLTKELETDFRRLGKRNLGRDDRVISHWGKEARYPFLDEVVVEWALRMPAWKKCGFGQILSTSADKEQTPVLEPAKLVLRLIACKLGMPGVAAEKKRAIQFGARTAKMETGRTKGTQIIS